MTTDRFKNLTKVLHADSRVQDAVKKSITQRFEIYADQSILFHKDSWSVEFLRNSFSFRFLNVIVVIIVVAMTFSSCKKLQNELDSQIPVSVSRQVSYVQTNLVSDTVSNNAARLDPTLVNAWGIAINPNGIFWINSNGKDLTEVWDKNGLPKRNPVTVPTPSGILFNTTTDFVISATNEVSRFIFASEDGKIYAWASGDSARTVVNRTGENSVYKGIELANDGSGNFLYATDFHNNKVDIFDKSFNLVSTKPFNDTKIPSNFAPFNIRLIDKVLFVTYAKQLPPDNHDDEKGPGNGFIDIFDTNGSLLRRFVTHGRLNSPWGIEKAPEGFGQGKNMILIGNFGDGHINIYKEGNVGGDGEGKGEGGFVKALQNSGKPVTIDGLWGITFPDGRVPGDDPNKLYFTAGPNEENHGLFGYILKQ
jgi:uncharacterized protein (TIGR03118 family)